VRTKVDEGRLAAWMSLMQARSALVQTLEREMETSRGLSLSEYDVLVRLHGAPEGRLGMQELATAVQLSKSGMTRLVDRMERAGLIERQACPSDRRVTWATLTANGRSELRRALPVFLESLKEHFARHLDDRDVEGLRSALGKVLRANDGAGAECPSAYRELTS
jgi:DNA-binding MarR family transcriptional regulator